jgi:hypothetical protein
MNVAETILRGTHQMLGISESARRVLLAKEHDK